MPSSSFPLSKQPVTPRRRFVISPQVRSFFIHVAIAFVIGLLWYFILYQRYSLYTSHVNWIYNAGGDALQHQLGWEFFRQEPWRFPLGTIEKYGYPIGTSAALMDSIPLLAIPFKLISTWLEPDFQYFGLWELSALMGQMLLGMLILNEFTRSYPQKILGASVLVLSAPMIFRAFYHNSLSAHWILLAAIWFVILEYRRRLWRGAWIALFAVAMLIHVYFIPMIAPLWLVGMFFHYRSTDRPWNAVFEILAVAAAILLVGYTIGFLQLEYGRLSSNAFGHFSWNLNGLFNPMHFGSQFVKQMPVGVSGQYEGFSYLGLGNLLLLPIALYLFVFNEQPQQKRLFLLPLAAAAIVYMLFALSNEAYAGTAPLWKIGLPDPLVRFINTFGTSGRFIWPVFYLVVLFGLVVVIRNNPKPVLILGFALLLQFFDLQPVYMDKRLADFTQYEARIEGPFWQAAAAVNDHLMLLPGIKLPLEYEQFAIFAVDSGQTLNLGYFARPDIAAIQAYSNQAWSNLNAGKLDPATLYVIIDSDWARQAKGNLRGRAYVCEVDGYSLFFSAQHGLADSGYDLSQHCQGPIP